MEFETQNALVESAELRLDRDCFLCFWVGLKLENGFHQSFGGHVLANQTNVNTDNNESYCARYLSKAFEVLDVDSLAKMKGKTIRIRKEADNWNSEILAIGHIIEDTWLDPKELLNQ